VEREEYELAIEEQAYPFEEKAIQVHESNLELISRGVYNGWVEKSLLRLAEFVPARYDKPEETSGIITSLETYTFAIDRPAPAESAVAKTEETEPAEPPQAEEPGAIAETEPAEPAPVEEPEAVTEAVPTEPAQAEETEAVTEIEPAEPVQAEEPEAVTETEPVEPVQGDHAGPPPIRADRATRR
jgi:hypothetical protein